MFSRLVNWTNGTKSRKTSQFENLFKNSTVGLLSRSIFSFTWVSTSMKLSDLVKWHQTKSLFKADVKLNSTLTDFMPWVSFYIPPENITEKLILWFFQGLQKQTNGCMKWVKKYSTITYVLYRNSHQRCSIKKVALKKFANFTGKPQSQSLFFNEFLRTPFLEKTFERLLLTLRNLFPN